MSHFARNSIKRRSTTWISALLLTIQVTSLQASEPVIAYRNGGSGAYPEADPPLEWSVTKNVVWRWDAPPFGVSIASLIVVGDRLITLTAPCGIVCLDKHSGKELWQRTSYLEKPDPQDSRAFIHQEVMKRAYRIKVLQALLTKEHGGSNELAGQIKLIRSYMSRSSPEDKAFFQQRIDNLEALIKDGKAKREAYRSELDALKAVKDDVGKMDFLAPCAAAPASDGERIYATFYPGLVVCCDLEGETQWVRSLTDAKGRRIKGSWGHFAEVPACADGKLLVIYGGEIFCFDAASGKTLWRPQHGKEGWKSRKIKCGGCAASPLLTCVDGVWYFVTASGHVGLLESGKLIHESKMGGGGYYQPVLASDGRTVLDVTRAIRLPEKAGGEVSTLWTIPEIRRGDRNDERTIVAAQHCYCAPAHHDGILYHYMNARDRFTAIDAATGKLFYEPVRQPKGKKHLIKVGHSKNAAYADMILAGDHIIMFSLEGDSVVLKTGKKFGIVRRNPEMDRVWSNDPVFEGRRMYLRTHDHLFCFEKPAGE